MGATSDLVSFQSCRDPTLACFSCPSAAQAPLPNIRFWVLTDAPGWGDFGVYFQNTRTFASSRPRPTVATPLLDTMATQGMRMNLRWAWKTKECGLYPRRIPPASLAEGKSNEKPMGELVPKPTKKDRRARWKNV
jgi:hypothetical protein